VKTPPRPVSSRADQNPNKSWVSNFTFSLPSTCDAGQRLGSEYVTFCNK
jgi:hypothetical protein